MIEWRPDHPIDDDEYDPDFSPSDLPEEDLDDDFFPVDAEELLSLDQPMDDTVPLDPEHGATTRTSTKTRKNQERNTMTRPIPTLMNTRTKTAIPRTIFTRT